MQKEQSKSIYIQISPGVNRIELHDFGFKWISKVKIDLPPGCKYGYNILCINKKGVWDSCRDGKYIEQHSTGPLILEFSLMLQQVHKHIVWLNGGREGRCDVSEFTGFMRGFSALALRLLEWSRSDSSKIPHWNAIDTERFRSIYITYDCGCEWGKTHGWFVKVKAYEYVDTRWCNVI
jgi:hypothetical protein